MSERFSAEDQIEQIIEQARIVERKSVNRMAFLQDVSALYLLGLRHLAKEIDQLHDPLGVVSDLVLPRVSKCHPSNGPSSRRNWINSHRK